MRRWLENGEGLKQCIDKPHLLNLTLSVQHGPLSTVSFCAGAFHNAVRSIPRSGTYMSSPSEILPCSWIWCFGVSALDEMLPASVLGVHNALAWLRYGFVLGLATVGWVIKGVGYKTALSSSPLPSCLYPSQGAISWIMGTMQLVPGRSCLVL